MSSNKFFGNGLTYDDVLLVPSYSDVLPSDVSIKSKFSKNIDLNIPISSAAMDTVTQSSMGIAIAREGGIGVLHKNMSIQEQAEEVRSVKRSESGMIMDPITLNHNSLVFDAKEKMRNYKIGGIPIIDEKGKLKGIVTNRDLRFEKNNDRAIKEVMTSENIITVNKGISLKEAEKILQKNKIEKLPVVDKSNNLIGLITFRDISNQTKKPIANKDKYGRLRICAAVGITNDVLDRVALLKKSDVDAIVVDTSHAHSKNVANVLKSIKMKFSDIDVIVGNIATAEAAIFLANEGADGVKVGIGPGSICTTRVISGVGFPQLSAILEVSNALNKMDVPVIADGGIRYTGDIPKAIAAGADSVMLGSLLAGTKESPGETVIYEGRKYKTYRGMGSVEAMKKGSKDRYFQGTEEDLKKFVPEGIVGRVPFKGDLEESIHQFVGGLRSGMGYCGAKNIKTLKTKSKFVKITPATVKENHPHNITITKEAPNYSP
jgi:IMP dehydrogenase